MCEQIRKLSYETEFLITGMEKNNCQVTDVAILEDRSVTAKKDEKVENY